MKSDNTSSPQRKYKYDIIRDYILAYKKEHDGISPPIRHISEWYRDIEGLYASTSVMRNILKRICQNNNWNYTYRGIETKGEWNENSSESS